MRAGELPAHYVERVTAPSCAPRAAPARRARALPPAPMLCADTTVALGRAHLRQARATRETPRACSRSLAGTHAPRPDRGRGRRERRRRRLRVSDSRVTFAPIAPAQIARYVASGEPVRQGGRLRDPERGSDLDRAHRRELHRYHGTAAARDGARCSSRRGGVDRLGPSGLRSSRRARQPRCKTS